jgi:hypothetical protein
MSTFVGKFNHDVAPPGQHAYLVPVSTLLRVHRNFAMPARRHTSAKESSNTRSTRFTVALKKPWDAWTRLC